MSASTNLAQRLRARIEHEGPISFYEWMKAALYDEREGYYCRADRIPQGKAGDYRTAPETSPLFAATFGDYFAMLHSDLKWPRQWTIFEMGAGSGQFAQGVLRHLRKYEPNVFASTNYVIDEIGAAAQSRAGHRLSEFADRVSFQRVSDDMAPVTGIVFSNEFIDSFPVHRVVMSAGRLCELCVGLTETGFTWVECEMQAPVADYCLRTGMQLSEGQVAEVNLEAEKFVSRAAALLDRGYLVTVDYGSERDELWGRPDRHLGTLRAFYRHQMLDDVLARPGEQDLTTTIDWTQIQETGARAGLTTLRFERLDQFLGASVGAITGRMIRENVDPVEMLRFTTSARELYWPNGLASYFHVLVQEKVAQL